MRLPPHYMELEELAVSLEVPKRDRVAAQLELRVEQTELCKLPENRIYSWPKPGDNARRYIQACLGHSRASRRGAMAWQSAKPWSHLLRDWTPEKRCDHAFAVDATGELVDHWNPSATRWCLAGWLSHLAEDERDARRLLDEVWSMVPPGRRIVVERALTLRVKAKDRKRLDQHPLGYWWYIAPKLAARFLGIPT